MAKKKPSKNAKKALKVLSESKLLANAKTINDSKAAQVYRPSDAPIKPGAANKMRPEKKRG